MPVTAQHASVINAKAAGADASQSSGEELATGAVPAPKRRATPRKSKEVAAQDMATLSANDSTATPLPTQQPTAPLPESRAQQPTEINLPAIVVTATPPETATPTLPPSATRNRNAALTAYDIAVLPGTHRHVRPPVPGAPRRRPGAGARLHRVLLAAVVMMLALMAITAVPLVRGNLLPGVGSFIASASGFSLPTPTPTPSPTPVIYPLHPVVWGESSFVCVALPFARLAQSLQIQDGIAHPWYVSVILAQWGVEQGWSIPSYTGYNWGNVSAIAGYPSIGGTGVWGSPSAFAYAYTPMQGTEYYVIFTMNGWYNGVTNAWSQGPQAQAYALGQSPWDAGHYGENGSGPGGELVGDMNAFNLYRFDNPKTEC